jgi:hypothetical protein
LVGSVESTSGRPSPPPANIPPTLAPIQWHAPVLLASLALSCRPHRLPALQASLRTGWVAGARGSGGAACCEGRGRQESVKGLENAGVKACTPANNSAKMNSTDQGMCPLLPPPQPGSSARHPTPSTPHTPFWRKNTHSAGREDSPK